MNILDFHRMTDVLKRKIFLLLGRALLTAINNSEGTMKVQVTALKDETISDIERFEEYGFTSYPKLGSAECVIGFLNGNRDHGIVLCIHDRAYRPKDLVEGEARLYNSDGKTRVSTKTGLVEITAGGTLEFASLASKIKTIVDDYCVTKFNAHVHTCAGPGNPSSVPTALNVAKPVTDYQSSEVKIS